MALYAFDGTGNEDQETAERDSNVVDFFAAYIDPHKNDEPKEEVGSLYLKGIGRRAKTFIGKGAAEAFGLGGHQRVRQAMDRLENNLDAGDNTVDIVGFSRGAALAMSFANEVDKQQPDVVIRFLGVFDLVGQFGLPGRHLNAGHMLALPDNVKTCRHAMAMDETRALFPLTRLCDDHGKPADSLVELWFRGVHSDVGGGNGNRGMNWIALNWMFANALRAGLPIDQREVERNLQDRGLPQQIRTHDIDLRKKRSFFETDCMHESVLLDAPPDRFYNNPTFAMRRMNDLGGFVEQVARARTV
jgi:uncharacterized protein (DUF2235 family)